MWLLVTFLKGNSDTIKGFASHALYNLRAVLLGRNLHIHDGVMLARFVDEHVGLPLRIVLLLSSVLQIRYEIVGHGVAILSIDIVVVHMQSNVLFFHTQIDYSLQIISFAQFIIYFLSSFFLRHLSFGSTHVDFGPFNRSIMIRTWC